MTGDDFIIKRPTRASFKGGRAIYDIFDDQGVKWIAKGQLLSEKQITIALQKGTLARAQFDSRNLSPQPSTKNDLKPTFEDILKLTDQIEVVETAKNEDIKHQGKLNEDTEKLITDSSQALLELVNSNQFSPYKLTGLTSFLYNEEAFRAKRPFLKTLNNTGTQYTLFNGIITDGINDLVVANLLNPFSLLEQQVNELDQRGQSVLAPEAFQQHCQSVVKILAAAMQSSKLSSSFLNDLLKYFSPQLYFTSPELRLFQQINQYVNYLMPGRVTEQNAFKLSNIPVLDLANYFKQPKLGGGLGIEGARIVQYVGLIPSGTAVQFNNREKGLIIAPETRDSLYCVVITGMDGQPLLTPSLRKIKFRDLGKNFKIIPSAELPLKYESHSHEKIWKMHIVHEKLKSSSS